MKFVCLTLLLMTRVAQAEYSIDLARSGFSSSFSNDFTARWSDDVLIDDDTQSPVLGLSVGLALSQSQFIINLNSNFSDFTVENRTGTLDIEFSVFDQLILNIQPSRTLINTDEAKQEAVTGSVSTRFNDLSIGLEQGYSRTQQSRDVIILNRNVKDDIQVTQRSISYFLTYSLTENFNTSARFTSFTYNDNVESTYNLLTTQLFLDRAGGGVASEIASFNKESYDLSISYLYTNWLFSMTGGASRELLDPQAILRFASIGSEYSFDTENNTYRVYANYDYSKPDSSNDTSHGFSLGLGLSF